MKSLFQNIFAPAFLLFFIYQVSNAQGNPISGTPIDFQDQILFNQVGYPTEGPKVALLRAKTDIFEVVDAQTGKVVFTGKSGALAFWDLSGDSVRTADFSKVNTPGKYRICLNNKSLCSGVFEIGDGVYSEIAKASLKSFYLIRSGMEITEEFGGKYARPAGHPDTAVLVHASAASDKRPEGFTISSPGGWYDAGDYNKYIVNSSITTYTLLLFCQMYPEYVKNFAVNIPESNNRIPDVLDELLFNLKWMLTMQDPNDGGVYHKLTNKNFDAFVMPDKATAPRYVVYKSTAASLDFAATMAMAYRILSQSTAPEIKQLGINCLEQAKKAYAWAKANPAIYYKNPKDIATGEYDDRELADEFLWAATELGLAMNDFSEIKSKDIAAQKKLVQSWDYTGPLAIISLSLSDNPKAAAYRKEAQKALLSYADILVSKAESSPYRLSLDFFKWGSTSDVANMALIKLVANRISKDQKYLNSVQGDVDYLLGRNATGYCFVTGFGDKQVMNLHHRPSGADGIKEPYPGLLSGGPNTVTFADCPDLNRSKLPAISFVDHECSYSTNESAINWNAPLVFILGAMDSAKK